MNNKFRDELREALLVTNELSAYGRMTVFRRAAKMLEALLSGTHEEYWLGPKIPSQKMQIAGRDMQGRADGLYKISLIFEAMRDACEEERRG